jgi:hypothetical protein
LTEVLTHLGPIWPGRILLGGIPLGDCWRHPAIKTGDATDQLAPLHKLSQWLTYSLIEPMERAGIEVTEIDGLTGLAEYRNGGLFIDTGVLALRDRAQGAHQHEVGLDIGCRMARPDSCFARPVGRPGAAAPAARCLRSTVAKDSAGRNLGCGASHCPAAASRRFAAAARD